jgi:hypothetical protein
MVYTDLAVWSSQLRFHKAAMLEAAATFTNPVLTNIQIRLISQK